MSSQVFEGKETAEGDLKDKPKWTGFGKLPKTKEDLKAEEIKTPREFNVYIVLNATVTEVDLDIALKKITDVLSLLSMVEIQRKALLELNLNAMKMIDFNVSTVWVHE